MRVENLAPYAQPEVHGLLGQRAIDPKPPVQALVEQPANSDKNELAALATTTLSAALNLGGVAACVTRLCARPVPSSDGSVGLLVTPWYLQAAWARARRSARRWRPTGGRSRCRPACRARASSRARTSTTRWANHAIAPPPLLLLHLSQRHLHVCGAGQDGLVARARRVQVLALHRLRRRRGVSLRGLPETSIGCGKMRRGL